MNKNELLIIILALTLSTTLTMVLGIWPGPDEDSGSSGGIGWTIYAYVYGEYKDAFHYYYTYHKGSTSIWGLIWYASDLYVIAFTECTPKDGHIEHTSGSTWDFPLTCYTEYAKTVTKRWFRDVTGNEWLGVASAAIVASP